MVGSIVESFMEKYSPLRDSKKEPLDEGFYLHTETNTPCYIYSSNASRTGWVRESGDLHVGVGTLDKRYASGLEPITIEEAGKLLNKLVVDVEFLSSRGVRQDPQGRLRIRS